MELTVKQIIARLKKMPQNAKVCFATHDQNWEAGEYDGTVTSVNEVPKDARHHGCAVVLS